MSAECKQDVPEIEFFLSKEGLRIRSKSRKIRLLRSQVESFHRIVAPEDYVKWWRWPIVIVKFLLKGRLPKLPWRWHFLKLRRLGRGMEHLRWVGFQPHTVAFDRDGATIQLHHDDPLFPKHPGLDDLVLRPQDLEWYSYHIKYAGEVR